MALDEAEAASEWIAAAGATYPMLIDPDHRSADLLGIVNVPSAVWIDEDDCVVRPPVIAPGDDTFREFTKIDAEVHHDQLRAWVREGVLPPDLDAERAGAPVLSDDDRQARAHRRLGAYLHRAGRDEAAARQLAAANRLAAMDWTIRRGTLPMQGLDPFGTPFFDFYQEWEAAGRPGYGAPGSTEAS